MWVVCNRQDGNFRDVVPAQLALEFPEWERRINELLGENHDLDTLDITVMEKFFDQAAEKLCEHPN
jgi:hypothetical protein